MKNIQLSIFLFIIFLTMLSCAKEKDVYVPKYQFSDYSKIEKNGFNIYLITKDKSKSEVEDYLDNLDTYLPQVVGLLPNGRVSFFKTINIWLQSDIADLKTIAKTDINLEALYVPFDYTNSIEEQKGGVLINTAAQKVNTDDENINTLIHEMSHAYHEKQLVNGNDNIDVINAYNNAKTQKLYDNVKDKDGDSVDAYLMTDRHEFFAVISTMYLFKERHEPFNKSGLETFDPNSFDMAKKIWED